MRRHTRRATCAMGICASILLSLAPSVQAGLMDTIKKKVAEKTPPKPAPAVGATTTSAQPAAGEAAAKPSGDAAAKPSGGSDAKVSSVSTKFDFVPGDSVMLVDDFTLDDLGEFPVRWRLTQGTFEVAEMKGERWLRCTSVDGRVRMKVPGLKALPEFWTLEFDFYGTEPMGSALTVSGMKSDDRPAWAATYPQGTSLAFATGSIESRTPLEGATTPAGRHHVMVMARGTALKVYMDRQRLANVPEIEPAGGPPTDIEFRLSASTGPMITNVRFAEGCRPAKDMLAEGKLVTYGIRFDTGSDIVLPESAPVLRQIASYLESNAAVHLLIVGHTDNVGSAASNLDLSKRRAVSVAKVLAEQFAIAPDRLTTDGKGDTQSIASNAKPEGRAMNRRVEFSKVE